MPLDFLQIHDSTALTAWEIDCIASVKAVMLPEDTYTWIDIPTYSSKVEAVNASDRARFDWLVSHKNGVYVDTDCKLHSRFSPATRGTCFLPRNSIHETHAPDIFYIFVNGDTEWIKRNFSGKVRKSWIDKNVQKEIQKDYYGWPLKLLENLSGFQFLPDEIYTHNYQTLQSELKRRSQKMENTKRQPNQHELAAKLGRMLTSIGSDIYLYADAITELQVINENLRAENEKLKAELTNK